MRPTKTGWYWLDDDGEWQVVRVTVADSAADSRVWVALSGVRSSRLLSSFLFADWSGPIENPDEWAARKEEERHQDDGGPICRHCTDRGCSRCMPRLYR